MLGPIMVTAAGWTPEQLYQESEAQWRSLEALAALVDRVQSWYEDTTVDVEKARLWEYYEKLCRDYRVLFAWYSVTYSASVLADEGPDLRVVDPLSLIVSEEVIGSKPIVAEESLRGNGDIDM